MNGIHTLNGCKLKREACTKGHIYREWEKGSDKVNYL